MTSAIPPTNLDVLLAAAEKVVLRHGIASMTLDAVAAEAGMSKGGLLHHFPSKDRLIQALVARSAEGWRGCYMSAYELTPEGPGRMSRALLSHCLSDAECWTDQLRSSSSAVFAALAQNPSLIEPMRAVYSELHQKIAEDGLPPGIGETVAAAIDGLWLDWVLGLVPLDQARVVRVRKALEELLERAGAPVVNSGPQSAARCGEGAAGAKYTWGCPEGRGRDVR
ncbi:MAG: TetR/AcrR family transcriptional regulator [Phycisphaerales bacterium]|nr:TetR/AcrR family transcriptional regulator [Phycisphaerales bacterium]